VNPGPLASDRGAATTIIGFFVLVIGVVWWVVSALA
jgi:hypothetical protein